MIHTQLLCLLSLLLMAQPAMAGCTIKNTTDLTLVISSGHVRNQRVGPHAETQIDDGPLTGKANDKRLLSGVCPDNGAITVTDDGKNLTIQVH